jgi:hypothetical protein
MHGQKRINRLLMALERRAYPFLQAGFHYLALSLRIPGMAELHFRDRC